VFVQGQGVPESIEVDGLDERCTHFAAYRDEALVGTARLRVVGGAAKAERVAVASSVRGAGVGRALMRALEAEAKRMGLASVILNAQAAVIPFYERLGYATEGERFFEAGIEHCKMRRAL
jgi:predicted GNAT family N-acyltransferase